MFSKLMHHAINNENIQHFPFWFMRQAGRYLPEYRELRAKAGGFLNMCYNPDMASEITLQPIRRFGLSAAIIFSDILVIPNAMGIDVQFEQGEGPKLSVTRDYKSAQLLNTDIEQHLKPVSEAIEKTRRNLDKEKSLIGFCGAPWTVACYMVEGKGSRDYEDVRKFAIHEEKTFSLIIEKIIESSVSYLSMQVKSGADIIQIFDSWAGVLSENEYKKWVIEPTARLVSQFKKIHPGVPVIGFPRGSGTKYKQYSEQVGVDVISIDVQTPLKWAANTLNKPIQGNLDPVLLACDKDAAVAQTKEIIEIMQGRAFIFNLGHGILQHTPVENVHAVCEAIRS